MTNPSILIWGAKMMYDNVLAPNEDDTNMKPRAINNDSSKKKELNFDLQSFNGWFELIGSRYINTETMINSNIMG